MLLPDADDDEHSSQRSRRPRLRRDSMDHQHQIQSQESAIVQRQDETSGEIVHQENGECSTPSSSQMNERRPNLRLLIPPRTLDSLELSKPPISPSSASSSRTKRGVLPRPSFRSRVSTTPPAPKHHQAPQNQAQQQQQQQQHSPGSLSATLARMFNPSSSRKTSSLPVTPVGDTIVSIDQTGMEEKLLSKAKFERSLSAPLKKTKSLKRTAPSGGMVILVKPATPHLSRELSKDTGNASSAGEQVEDEGEEIPVEQAVCRICMDGLGEGGSTLKAECSCKGELALAHEECAVKWFGIKGNRTCDICGDEVRNLPVTLTRRTNDHLNGSRQQGEISRMQGIWHDVPVLVMISMLAYFCLLEQLLVKKMGSGALVIALPFACVLGLLASVTAATLVTRRFIWAYAALQFALVSVFAHIFYNLVHVEAVLSILLSAFAGFGIAMSFNGLCLEYISWRRRQPENRNNIELQPVA